MSSTPSYPLPAYPDTCWECFDQKPDGFVIVSPHRYVAVNPGRWEFVYTCPSGHGWRCQYNDNAPQIWEG